jgi:hypothetical protein
MGGVGHTGAFHVIRNVVDVLARKVGAVGAGGCTLLIVMAAFATEIVAFSALESITAKVTLVAEYPGIETIGTETTLVDS